MRKFVVFLCLLLSVTLLTGCSAEALAESLEKSYYTGYRKYHMVGEAWNVSDFSNFKTENGEKEVKLSYKVHYLEQGEGYILLKLQKEILSEPLAQDGRIYELFINGECIERIEDEAGRLLELKYYPSLITYPEEKGYIVIDVKDEMTFKIYLKDDYSTKYVKLNADWDSYEAIFDMSAEEKKDIYT